MLTSMSHRTLTDIFEEIEELSALFYIGELAADLDSDRKEYVQSHLDLLRTLNPGILGITYRKNDRQEFAILRYKSRIVPVNISRMSDEEATNTLLDYAWECVTEVN